MVPLLEVTGGRRRHHRPSIPGGGAGILSCRRRLTPPTLQGPCVTRLAAAAPDVRASTLTSGPRLWAAFLPLGRVFGLREYSITRSILALTRRNPGGLCELRGLAPGSASIPRMPA